MNKIVRRLVDGVLKPGEAMCEKHINQFTEDTLEITPNSTGASCLMCQLEEANSSSSEVPMELIKNITGQTLEGLTHEDQNFILNSPPLLCMLHGFVHAMVLCEVPVSEIPDKGRAVLLECWTRAIDKNTRDIDIDNP